jgi:outer membrane protein
MHKKLIAALLATAGLVSAAPAMAEGPLLVRARAVYVDFDNDQRGDLPLAGVVKVEADSRWIPEVDISYFFTKNLAAELVLTAPSRRCRPPCCCNITSPTSACSSLTSVWA